MSIVDLLKAQDDEIKRWLLLTAGWSDEDRARVVLAWLGLKRAKEMNDHLEKEKR